jgi:hypothetical protein
VKISLKQLTNEMVNDKLKAALTSYNESPSLAKENPSSVEPEAAEVTETPQIVTTPEEIEGYATVKVMLKEVFFK